MQVMLLLISMFVVGICFFNFSLEKKMNSKLIEKSYNHKRGEFKQIKLSDINAQLERQSIGRLVKENVIRCSPMVIEII